MTSEAKTPAQYIKELPADRKEAVAQLRDVVLKNLPLGFKEQMGYGMLGYAVPHSIYPPGYHCDPKMPYHLQPWPHRKILLLFTIWGFMVSLSC